MRSLKNKILRIIVGIAAFILALLFVIIFGGPAILKGYLIETGIGDCRKNPIFCLAPLEGITNPPINEEYLRQLVPFEFPGMTISTPKGFTVVKETIKKVYYKRRKRLDKGAVIYLLEKEPGFFLSLYPDLSRSGISNNYEFLKETMYAKTSGIKGITSAFFVVMKGIFVPDVGDQNSLKMSRFSMGDKKGFINYNLVGRDHYFDCNIVDNKDEFFKVYIKDIGGSLSLDDALAVISTVRDGS